MLLRKHEREDRRAFYRISFQIGVVASLALLILAFNADLPSSKPAPGIPALPDVIPIEMLPVSTQPVKPPPPPRPAVLAVVPDDTELEDVPFILDAAILIDEVPAVPPPPDEPRGSEEYEPFEIVEQMPELIGGIAALLREVRYPQMAIRAGVEGRVVVQFIVDENGDIVDPKVLAGIGAGCDEEAVRAVRKMQFRPGRQRGEAVRVRMSLPILFRLR